MIFDVLPGSERQLATRLAKYDGARLVDLLEDSNRVLLVLEARYRRKLAAITASAIATAAPYTENVELLPVQN